MCIHLWEIDINEVGTCKHCGEVKDFKAIRKSKYAGGDFLRWGQAHRRPQTESEYIAEKRYQDSFSLDILAAKLQAGFIQDRRARHG